MLTNEHNYPCNFITIYFFLHEPVAWHKHNTRMRWILYVMCVRAETSQQALGSPGLFQVIKCCRHAGFCINYISLSGLFKGSESSVEFLKVTFLSSRWSISEAPGLHPGSAQPETRERCWSMRIQCRSSGETIPTFEQKVVNSQRSKGQRAPLKALWHFMDLVYSF